MTDPYLLPLPMFVMSQMATRGRANTRPAPMPVAAMDWMRRGLSQMVPPAAADLIRRNEGPAFQTPGKDFGNGQPLIGYSFAMNRPDAGRMMREVGIRGQATPEQSEELLNKVISKDADFLRKKVNGFDELSPQRQAVLLDMVYNMGQSRFSGFKRMLNAVNEGDFDRAAEEILNSKYAKQVPGRAKRNYELMREDDLGPYRAMSGKLDSRFAKAFRAKAEAEGINLEEEAILNNAWRHIRGATAKSFNMEQVKPYSTFGKPVDIPLNTLDSDFSKKLNRRDNLSDLLSNYSKHVP